MVLDGTNQLHFAFAWAVLKGIKACAGVIDKMTPLDTFVAMARNTLMADLYPYVQLCVAVGAKDLVIGLDGVKEDVALMHKGCAALEMTAYEQRKLE